jgi:hypothetical protein
MNSDDDQIWFDALAGREPASSATAREARALRAALHSVNTPVGNVRTIRDATREEALIARATQEGVIRAAPRRRPMSWQLPLAASVLMIVAAGIVLQLRTPPDTAIMRGNEDGIVRLEAVDAAALKRQILAELRTAGVNATGYEALGVHGIDADLSLPLSFEVQRVLAAHGIPEPADGVLRIEIRSSE